MWENVKKFLLSEDCSDIHKFIHENHAVITDCNGKQYIVNRYDSLNATRDLVNKVRDIYKHRQKIMLWK